MSEELFYWLIIAFKYAGSSVFFGENCVFTAQIIKQV